MSTLTELQTPKRVRSIGHAPARHWVGDGFPVHGLFGYSGAGVAERSPFLLLDYAAPTEFAPTTQRRGVGSHPHRGFETVTIVYAGEVEHRDSAGGGGVIGAGDVQWMTAGGGIIHEEFHSAAYAARGGTFEVVQLWVNLPAQLKMTPPAYQAIRSAAIPAVELAGAAGTLRVIAGEHNGQRGPAHTFTPMNVWDLQLLAGNSAELPAIDGWTTALIVLRGAISVNGSAQAGPAQMVLLERNGSGVQLQADSDALVLLLSGEPIDEPIYGHGPFVMNTQDEIIQAIDDFNSGNFGRIA